MNDLQRAAMQMAYETLERLSCVKQTMHLLWWQIEARKPLSVLREALAQPIVKESLTAQKQGEWIDLTDDEIKAAYEIWWEENGNHAFPIWLQRAKAAIAKFKSKNTPPAVPQGEPVIGAYEVVNESGTEFELVYPAAIHKYKMIPEHRITQTFYTTPPSSQLADAAVEAAIEATKEKAAKMVEDWDSDMADPRDVAAAIRSMK